MQINLNKSIISTGKVYFRLMHRYISVNVAVGCYKNHLNSCPRNGGTLFSMGLDRCHQAGSHIILLAALSPGLGISSWNLAVRHSSPAPHSLDLTQA